MLVIRSEESVLRLHYIPGSAAMAPHAALAEIGVPYELVLVERNDLGESTPGYLALNPSGRVPTLEDGELVLTEAAAILLHLADRYPATGLLPASGSTERSECYRWLIFGTNTLQTGMLRFLYPERYGTEGVQESAAAELETLFDRVDAHLSTRDWVAGTERTVADLFIFMVTRWGRHLDAPAWDRAHLRAHWLRCFELDGVRTMFAEQDLEHPPFAQS
jgi:glutathione S-transferase